MKIGEMHHRMHNRPAGLPCQTSQSLLAGLPSIFSVVSPGQILRPLQCMPLPRSVHHHNRYTPPRFSYAPVHYASGEQPYIYIWMGCSAKGQHRQQCFAPAPYYNVIRGEQKTVTFFDRRPFRVSSHTARLLLCCYFTNFM